ncbi:hypothetical protein A2935_01600 [Candidatus Wolfebacteria bacterium RIFCSPLOWO2_01_FULL_47_17b]|uniref:MazG nucleotide pyrophosphohydrolase n=1 Tax=Candidatus Wolfebacteria bacterium RIFCSPLOWO2_01_FULL_47_17b TaxID=1802558 RepID=A0A1F8E0F2_9BACT|nr:MAG: hypothetical protein A2935_01600 [Candidatus Wolfebacteria bacterium RIFCSPLOWO2_01_FULL_47_17b]
MRSIVICGSQRYGKEIKAFATRLRELGVPVVFEPNFNHNEELYSKNESERIKNQSYRAQIPAMVHEHFNKIRKADVCFIFNKDGYLGVNTTLELGFAHGHNMIIYALEQEPVETNGEICRDILFTEVLNTPEELVKRLV